MKLLKNQRGFTLIEMLIVMLIITVLIAIAIPNVSKQTSAVDEKGCKAFVQMVQGQVESYRMDKKAVPVMADLVSEGYLKTGETNCPNGEVINISVDGVVSSSKGS
ncbi:prepilin-type N-terminal cleavage/methylation domain-containing protein [Planococcus sp. CP5-4]|uniref:competence type IV pilus major pilin ComGC n=1 Tax=unclassified Planococcus (in: firmicutes) TaxID=2662419 RepID=UPI001C213A34|nr:MULTISPECIES: competence type IV pilus major pilin ComGC [unclassified Planococcus (in: firmicutes)]MBU9672773.1 prepilin-type N-terminal cleavage/methylation domain-containing protein [Planococcus sp. CP5-4_YE]MBV0908545.1 prepilin-type N-terminal cleavage/methylation domain-containing protein [Planococcus sp. CP5-4_UN]MBW6063314.1 prepilin-type N-terminal cleavage/methylation domain-containing protein [Planococcus sp. CP5-4]